MFQTEVSIYVDAVDDELEKLVDAICDVLAEHGYGAKGEDDDVRSFVVAQPVDPIPETDQDAEDWLREAISGGFLAAIPKHPE